MNAEKPSRLRTLSDRIAIPRDKVLAVLPVAVVVIFVTIVEPIWSDQIVSFVAIPVLNAWFWLQVPRPRIANWLYAVTVFLLLPASRTPLINESYSSQWEFNFQLAAFCISMILSILVRLVFRFRICDAQVRLQASQMISARPSIFDYLALTFAIAILSFAIRKSSVSAYDFRSMQIEVTSMVGFSAWLLVAFLVHLKFTRVTRSVLSVGWMIYLSIPLAAALSLVALLTATITITLYPNPYVLSGSKWDLLFSNWYMGIGLCLLYSVEVGVCALLFRWCGICLLPRNLNTAELLPSSQPATHRLSDRAISRIIYYSLSIGFCLLWLHATVSKTDCTKEALLSYSRGWPYAFQIAFESHSGFETTWFDWENVSVDLGIFLAVLALHFLLIPVFLRRFGTQPRESAGTSVPVAGSPSTRSSSTNTASHATFWNLLKRNAIPRFSHLFCLLVAWPAPLWLAALPNLPQLWEPELLLNTEHVAIYTTDMSSRSLFHAITSLSPTIITKVEIPDYRLVASDATLRAAVLRLFNSTNLRAAQIDGFAGHEQDLSVLLQNPGLYELKLLETTTKRSSLSGSIVLPSLVSIELSAPSGDKRIDLRQCPRLEEGHFDMVPSSSRLHVQIGDNPCNVSVACGQSPETANEITKQNLFLKGNITGCYISSDQAYILTIESTSDDLTLQTAIHTDETRTRPTIELNVLRHHQSLQIDTCDVDFQDLHLPLGVAKLYLAVHDGTIASSVITTIPPNATVQLISDRLEFTPQFVESFSKWKNLLYLDVNPVGISADQLIAALPVNLQSLDLQEIQLNSHQIHKLCDHLPSLKLFRASTESSVDIDFNKLHAIEDLTLDQCEQLNLKGDPNLTGAATFIIGVRPHMFDYGDGFMQRLVSICNSNITFDQFMAIANGSIFGGVRWYYLGNTNFGPIDLMHLTFPRAERIWLNWTGVDFKHLSDLQFEGKDGSVCLILQGFEGSAQAILEAVEQNPTSTCLGIVALVGDANWDLHPSWFRRLTYNTREWKFCGITLDDQFVSALDRLTGSVAIQLKDCKVSPELLKTLLDHQAVVLLSVSDPESLSKEVQAILNNQEKVVDENELPTEGLLWFD